jgi:cytosine/adenosine deaminase-related metal-dependent hydrolase
LVAVEADSTALDLEEEQQPTGAKGSLHAGFATRVRVRVLAVGTSDDVAQHEAAASARTWERPDWVLIPGLVNAHTHLDLTHIGPTPLDPERGFSGFVELVRTRRLVNEGRIAETVELGAVLSMLGGVVAVGDIAGAVAGRASLAAARGLVKTPLMGTSFLEFFAIGKGEERGLAGAAEAVLEVGSIGARRGFRVGLQPHAPNTVSLAGYRWSVREAAARGLLLTTHLAETADERAFIGSASGEQRGFLERLGIWDEKLLNEIGRGETPVKHLEPVLQAAMEAGRPFVVAHCNDVSDADIEILARTRTTVAYCPRASEYFRAEERFGSHRYREMMRAGVRVVLGTDSIINLPAAGTAAGGPAETTMSTLDEMRLLHRRDGMDGQMLLWMATAGAATTVGLDPELFKFTRGDELAGLVAIGCANPIDATDPLRTVLNGSEPPKLLFISN